MDRFDNRKQPKRILDCTSDYGGLAPFKKWEEHLIRSLMKSAFGTTARLTGVSNHPPPTSTTHPAAQFTKPGCG